MRHKVLHCLVRTTRAISLPARLISPASFLAWLAAESAPLNICPSAHWLMQEDQRRVSNRENVRDDFFGLLRDAASSAAPFAQSGPPAGLPAGHGAYPLSNAVIHLPSSSLPSLQRRGWVRIVPGTESPESWSLPRRNQMVAA